MDSCGSYLISAYIQRSENSQVFDRSGQRLVSTPKIPDVRWDWNFEGKRKKCGRLLHSWILEIRETMRSEGGVLTLFEKRLRNVSRLQSFNSKVPGARIGRILES